MQAHVDDHHHYRLQNAHQDHQFGDNQQQKKFLYHEVSDDKVPRKKWYVAAIFADKALKVMIPVGELLHFYWYQNSTDIRMTMEEIQSFLVYLYIV